MMKFLFLIFLMIPLCFTSNMFWLVQMIIFFLIFIFMIFNINLMFFFNLSYLLGCDMISYGLILLSMWICCLMIMSSEYIFKNNYYHQYFIFVVIFLLLMLYLTFSSMNLFMFYLFFEGSLIPTLILIIGWGYQPERIQAIMYLLFYTLFASLPLLLGIFFFKLKMESLMIYFMKFYDFNFIILYLCMIFAFLIKMPMFFVHLWLPKAHVEAPVSGSMILAGIMLKLGGYGLLRIMVVFQKIGLNYNFILISISLIGGFIISLICMCQIDIKCLIAYSSVVHMSMVLGGILTMNYWGIFGSYILMIGHGLCSSGMFCLININYERFYSRSLYINKGLLNYLPSMSMWWFLLLTSNMAAPPSLNLLGEISLLNSLISWSSLTMFMLMMISFFSAGYSLYLYSYSQHGLMYMGMYNFYNGVSREFLLLLLHWFPLNFFFLKLEMLIF